jgi:AcrR family transcriptional regulator/predicted nucleic acid-binding protein
VGIVLLDTSVVVAFLQPDDALHMFASAIVAEHVRARSQLAISVVTLTELFTGTVLGYQEEQVVNGFLEDFDVLFLHLESAIAKKAAQIRGEHTEATSESAARLLLNVPDALILATADLHPEIEIVIGGDKLWRRVAEGLDVRFVYLRDVRIPRSGAHGVGGAQESRSGYRRLPHGPHGMGREAVTRHQRTRLYGAMIEAVHRQGYRATTVAHVIALAGVSRRAFYAHFANTEACFLGTHDVVVARAKKRAMDGWMMERGWANRVRRSYEMFSEDAIRNAKSTRLVLVDGLGLGSVSRERMMRSSVAFERVLADGFRAAPDGVQLPPLGPKAIVGGGRYVMFDRLITGRHAEMSALGGELLDWTSAYRSPAARIGATRTPPPLTPARRARFLESDDERVRILGALTHLALDEDYRELTDPQIAELAEVSTGSFHEQFAGKAECMLTVVDAFVDETLETIIAGTADASSWPHAVYLGVKIGIEHLISHPGLTRIAFIDVFEVSSAVAESIGRTVGKLSDLLAKTAPEPRYAPAIVNDAVAGAMWAVVSSYAARQRVRYLPALVDHLAFIALAPYIGPKEAAQIIRAAG